MVNNVSSAKSVGVKFDAYMGGHLHTKQRVGALAMNPGIPGLVHGNVIPMGIPWETSHGMGQHTFVFPMRLRNRMRVSECY